MKIVVSGITALESGDVSVRVEVIDGTHREKKTMTVIAADWNGMKLFAGRELSEDEFDALEEAAAFCGALRAGINLLSYGANSCAALKRKLTRRGYPPEAAERAAAYLSEHGYINEVSDTEAVIRTCLSSGYGSRRIVMKLYEKGYSREAIAEAGEKLAEIDFTVRCTAMIRKKFGELPEERAARDKIVAAMSRYGYSLTEVRDAIRRLERLK